MSVGFEPVDWMTMCLELLRRLDRIADELANIATDLRRTEVGDATSDRPQADA